MPIMLSWGRNVCAVVLMLVIPTTPLMSAEKVGFWWYEDPVEKPKEENPYELPPLPSQQALAQLHPKELRKVITERKEYALWKKTPDAVADYYRVIDVARKNAVTFTGLSELVMLQNADLNARSQYPIIPAGRKAATENHQATISNKLAEQQANYALLFFTTQTCPYCKVQRNINKLFIDRYQWAIKEIDIEKNPEAVARFAIQTTPMTLLIERNSERWLPVAVGVEPIPTLETNVYRSIRLLRGEVDEKQFIVNEYEQGGFFDPEHYAERQERKEP